MKFILKLYLFAISTLAFPQDIIGDGLYGDELILYLQNNYRSDNILGYDSARDAMYGDIDNHSGVVSCIYTDFSVDNVPSNNPRPIVHEGGLNCEHIWPQSLYEGDYPMKNDLHHLRPCKENVNTARGNQPYDESHDPETNTWYWLSYVLDNPPIQDRDEYSENGDGVFEVKEERKGDIARTIFYFYTMYSDVASSAFFEEQTNTMLIWHNMDAADVNEIDRTSDIAQYQGNPNPFILDETLVERCYFFQENIMGDVNQDMIVNVLDVVMLMNHILGHIELDPDQFSNGDMNFDLGINILDIVLIIQEILE